MVKMEKNKVKVGREQKESGQQIKEVRDDEDKRGIYDDKDEQEGYSNKDGGHSRRKKQDD